MHYADLGASVVLTKRQKPVKIEAVSEGGGALVSRDFRWNLDAAKNDRFRRTGYDRGFLENRGTVKDGQLRTSHITG